MQLQNRFQYDRNGELAFARGLFFPGCVIGEKVCLCIPAHPDI